MAANVCFNIPLTLLSIRCSAARDLRPLCSVSLPIASIESSQQHLDLQPAFAREQFFASLISRTACFVVPILLLDQSTCQLFPPSPLVGMMRLRVLTGTPFCSLRYDLLTENSL
jgi:hypothetical protein